MVKILRMAGEEPSIQVDFVCKKKTVVVAGNEVEEKHKYPRFLLVFIILEKRMENVKKREVLSFKDF